MNRITRRKQERNPSIRDRSQRTVLPNELPKSRRFCFPPPKLWTMMNTNEKIAQVDVHPSMKAADPRICRDRAVLTSRALTTYVGQHLETAVWASLVASSTSVVLAASRRSWVAVSTTTTRCLTRTLSVVSTEETAVSIGRFDPQRVRRCEVRGVEGWTQRTYRS